ncbi:MAG: hypothetical protein ACKOQ2_05815, partial [Dolichospermum sp.]
YVVFDCINNIEKLRREQMNSESRIHAIGWSGLFNGFKGKDDPAMDFVDLLPFADDVRNSNKQVSDKTEMIIKQIIKKEEIPGGMLNILGMLIQ